MLWVVFASMTAAAVAALFWPLAARTSSGDGRSREVEFYKSQLAEVDDDVARGLVEAREADATRTEIARRLLNSAGQVAPTIDGGGFRFRRLVAAFAALALVPVFSIALYLQVGNPDQGDLPVASRDLTENLDASSVIPRIEAHLAAVPDDGRGFDLIAPAYLRLGRYDNAAKAYAAAIRLLGETAARRVAIGQAQVMAADGVVTSEARSTFEKALADDPAQPEAQFFLAIAAGQDGDRAKARLLFRQVAAVSSPDAPWMPAVRSQLADLGAEPGETQAAAGPDGAEARIVAAPATPAGAAIASLAPEQRQMAIRGMVDGLAARLAQNGRDPDGWLRLVRAYTVLGEADKARAALADARHSLKGDDTALSQLSDLARQLGLDS